MCVKCRIDNGALASAADALAEQARHNAEADDGEHEDLTTEQKDRLLALSEYNCRLAHEIRRQTEYIRLSRVGGSNGSEGVYGGEYAGPYVIDLKRGIHKRGDT